MKTEKILPLPRHADNVTIRMQGRSFVVEPAYSEVPTHAGVQIVGPRELAIRFIYPSEHKESRREVPFENLLVSIGAASGRVLSVRITDPRSPDDNTTSGETVVGEEEIPAALARIWRTLQRSFGKLGSSSRKALRPLAFSVAEREFASELPPPWLIAAWNDLRGNDLRRSSKPPA